MLADDVYQLLDWRADKLPRLLSPTRRTASAARRPATAASATTTRRRTTLADAAERRGREERERRPRRQRRLVHQDPLARARLGWPEAAPLPRAAERGYLVSGGGVAPFVSEVVAEVLERRAERGARFAVRRLRGEIESASRRARRGALRGRGAARRVLHVGEAARRRGPTRCCPWRRRTASFLPHALRLRGAVAPRAAVLRDGGARSPSRARSAWAPRRASCSRRNK